MERYFDRVDMAPIILPTRADVGSCGYDFYSPVTIEIKPHTCVKIPTYVKAYMNKDEALLLFVRSSIGIKKNLALANGTGLIDSTYVDNPDNQGNIIIALYNYGDETQVINAGDRVVQGVFIKYLITDDDTATKSFRMGGIGSSGI